MEDGRVLRPAVALMSHERMKPELRSLAHEYAATLGRFSLVTTRDASHLMVQHPKLPVVLVGEGVFGGDLEVAALAVAGQLAAVVFLRDPCGPQHDEPPLDAVQRGCDLGNIPLATNTATARAVLSRLGERFTNGLRVIPDMAQPTALQESRGLVEARTGT